MKKVKYVGWHRIWGRHRIWGWNQFSEQWNRHGGRRFSREKMGKYV